MSAIYQLVHNTLEQGYISTETEGRLRQLCHISNDFDDTDALVMLRQAVLFGHVKRQAVVVA
jgi:hypothetical protein